MSDNYSVSSSQKLLTVCKSDSEADIILALLKSYGINATKKYGNIDGYIKIISGTVLGEICIYVQSDAYDDAKALINAPIILNSDQFNDTSAQPFDNEKFLFDRSKLRALLQKLIVYFVTFVFILLLILKCIL